MSENIQSTKPLRLGLSSSLELNSNNNFDDEDNSDTDFAEIEEDNVNEYESAHSTVNDDEWIIITDDNSDNNDNRMLNQFATDDNVDEPYEFLLQSNNYSSNHLDHVKDINVNPVDGVINNHGNNTTTPSTAALFQACQGGHVQIVRELLKDKTLDVNRTDSNGVTPLMVACLLGHLEVVNELLSSCLWSKAAAADVDDDDTHGMVDVNIQDKRDGYTALIVASIKAHWDVVRVLLKHPNIDANLRCHDGYTALIMASKNGHVGVVRVLLQHPKKVNVNESCNEGRAAFSWACEEGHSDVVCEFLKHDTVVDAAVVNAKDNHGFTPLMVASMRDRLEVVRVLLNEEKVDFHARNHYGRTASSLARGACVVAWRKRFPNPFINNGHYDRALIISGQNWSRYPFGEMPNTPQRD